MTQEQADAKFNAWVAEKEAKISNKKSTLEQNARAAKKAALVVEAKVNADRAAELAKKKAEEEAAKSAAEAAAKAEAEAAAQAENAEETPAENTEA